MLRSLLIGIGVMLVVSPVWAADRPNLLIITVDDMSADSLGSFGCPVPGTSPRIDQLAQQGMRFTSAHVQVANCMPSRNVMWSGRFPHTTHVEGFYQVKDARYPHLVDLMKGAGYFTAIRHKISHSTPYSPYGWDLELDALPDGKRADAKNADTYRVSTERAIAAARDAGKPFCLVLNVADPHKPFYAEGNQGQTIPDPNVPTLTYTPDEMVVPGFLFDDPVVRKELSHYYSSVRRADDCVGAALDALTAAGLDDSTLVLFLSDHGMPLPFAKTQLYHHSTNTPLIVRWPGKVTAGAVDQKHMVSAVDLLPTLLDALGIAQPAGLQGRSFLTLLEGGVQDGRDHVIKEYNENAGGSREPMRAVQTHQFLYIFNPWSNGERVMATATSGTPTYRRMVELARTDPALAARLDLYQHRVPEELYDVAADPDCLHNLIADEARAADLKALRGQLEAWMVATADPMLPVFQDRDNAALRESFVTQQEAEAAARRQRGGSVEGEDGAGTARKKDQAKPRAARKKAAAAAPGGPG